jgi:hypothetical protein
MGLKSPVFGPGSAFQGMLFLFGQPGEEIDPTQGLYLVKGYQKAPQRALSRAVFHQKGCYFGPGASFPDHNLEKPGRHGYILFPYGRQPGFEDAARNNPEGAITPAPTAYLQLEVVP